MFKKIIGLLILVSSLFISFSACSQVPAITPPYPKVWGYDLLSLPAIKGGRIGDIKSYLMPDGDVWFLITHSYKTVIDQTGIESQVNSKYLLIKFFAREKKELSEEQKNELLKVIDKQNVPFQSFANKDLLFKDGAKLRLQGKHPIRTCFEADFYHQYFIKTDPRGLQRKHLILGIYPNVKMLKVCPCGDMVMAPYYYQKLHVLKNIIPLKDDTFIVFENDGNVIIRFDKNFKTQFKSLTPVRVGADAMRSNFFVINYSMIKTLEEELEKDFPIYQGVHDELLNHFLWKDNK